MQRKLIYEFGPFRLDPLEQQLTKHGRPVGLSPQLFSLLVVFVENAGHLLSKEKLRTKLWGQAYVSEDALKVIVGNLRKALGDGQSRERYVETIFSKGYRFNAAIKVLEEPVYLPEVSKTAGNEETQSPTLSLSPPRTSHTIFPKWHRPKGAFKTAAACIGIATVFLAAYYWKTHNNKHRPNPETLSDAVVDSRRTSLAVLGFRNISRAQSKDWLDVALTEMLSTELATGDGFRVVPPDRVARAKRELAFSDGQDATPQALESIRKNVNADLVVVGSYTVMPAQGGAQIRLDLRVQDTRTGEAKVWKSIVGREKDLFSIVSDAGRQLRRQLGLNELSPEQARGLQLIFPSHPKAAALYTQGLMALRSFDALQARTIFQKALEIEPDHPLIHAALATTLSSLGYEALAQQEGKTAVSLAKNLPLEERLSVEGQFRQSTREWDKAIDVYTTLFNYLPDRIEYGLQLANTQTSAGKSRDALKTLERLRKCPAYLDDGRTDLAQAEAELVIGDNQAAAEASQRAIARGNAAGARILVAEALSVKANADRYSRQIQSAISASEQAQRIYEEVGDNAGMARALVLRAGALRDNGSLTIRKKLFEEAITVFDQIGDVSDKARALNALAGVYQDLGDTQTTIAMYQSALRLREEIGDKGGAAICLNNIGTVYGTQGDLRRALTKYEEARARFTKLDSRRGIALTTGNIAGILERQGALAQSRAQNEQALTLYQELGAKDNIASHLENLGNIRFSQGDVNGGLTILRQALVESKTGQNKLLQAGILRSLGGVLTAQANFIEAEKAHAEASALISQIGGRLSASLNQMGIAQVMIAEGQYSQAEAIIRPVVKDFEKQRIQDALLVARDVLTRSLLGSKQCIAAKAEILRALQLARQSQDPRLRASIAITDSRVEGACDPGLSARAKARLQNEIQEAQARGFVALAAEARLVLVELEAATGISNMTDKSVAGLIQEANTRGFTLIANQAKELLSHPVSRSDLR
jgi:DNA-binding winged helix-turn-helix (wHTH) protein/tetratricopeptide (TPR) repeat protein